MLSLVQVKESSEYHPSLSPSFFFFHCLSSLSVCRCLSLFLYLSLSLSLPEEETGEEDLGTCVFPQINTLRGGDPGAPQGVGELAEGPQGNTSSSAFSVEARRFEFCAGMTKWDLHISRIENGEQDEER